MTNYEFVLPDVGEGLTEAEIVTWAVQPGDTVELNQVICEIETAKSLVEIPSPFSGEIAELLVATGTTVPVGTAILRMVGGEGPVDAGAAVAPAGSADAGAAAPVHDSLGAASATPEDPDDASGAVLVGYGTANAGSSRRRPGGQPVVPVPYDDIAPAAPGRPRATPPVRKLAKDLGVELTELTGSGADGEILRGDVSAAGGRAPERDHTTDATAATAASTTADAVGTVNARRGVPRPGDRDTRVPVKGIRKVVAQAMVESKFTAPHTSVFLEVDATRTMKLVKRLKHADDFAEVRVSPLLIMARAVLWAIARNPEVNSKWAGDEIIRRSYVNLGIAAATPRGLVVPNIPDAQELSLSELAAAMGALTTRARDGLTQPSEMQHGTVTITNVGVFGVDFGLPILNPGETAIVAMGAIREKPWVVGGKVRPRLVTTIGGSFDHRVVDGDVISRFVADIGAAIERPERMLG